MTPQTPVDDAGERHVSFDEALSIARQLLSTNRLAEAEQLLDLLEAAAPDHPDVLHFRGLVRYRAGETGQAIALIRQAIATVPDCADFHLNLGNMLAEDGDLDGALAQFEETLRLRPDDAGVWNNLGSLYRICKRFEDAEAAFHRALALDAECVGAFVNLGGLHQKRREHDKAIENFRHAIELQPGFGQAYQLLADVHIDLGDREKAGEVLREWIDHDPQNPAARHYYAARGFAEVPERAADDYVATTFDKFAPSFENQLNDRLRYRAPQLVAQLLEEHLPPPAKQFKVLDAGCGTGLCGPLIAPWAKRLVGVDLSAGMLAKARDKDAYDLLEKAELSRYLREHQAEFELILSADTLCYFGPLDAVSASAAGALRPGGYLAFTVELLRQGGGEKGFQLEASGRYRHARDYVATCLDDAGFETLRIEHAHLRTEGGNPVDGLVVVARRPVG